MAKFRSLSVAVTLLVVLLSAALAAVAQAAVPTEQAKLTASDAAGGDEFGRSVGVSGDTAVIGASGDDDAGSSSGSAYVFVRSGTTWTEQAKLTASDAAGGDNFGRSAAVDGDTAVLGALGDDDDGSFSGSAYVFTRSGTTWTEQAKLTASDAAASDQFGSSVAISGDTIVVGSVGDDDDGSFSGSAYVFTRSGTTWTEQAKLTASDAATGDNFGNSVAVDGDTALIAAIGDDDGGSQSGSAYAFTRSGTTWTEQAKLTASDAVAGDGFGRSAAVDGDAAVIGAPGDGSPTNLGSAYVFTRSGTTWAEQAKLTASDAAIDDQFGNSVGVSGDTALIGADGPDSGGSGVVTAGAAYLYNRSGTTWTEQAKLTASDAASGDNFGFSVAVEGDSAVIGAVGDDDAGSFSGSTYVFATPQCQGVAATISGMSGVINGTAGDDVIVGSPEADTISGLGGNDLICGGNGKDTILGGNGADTLIGDSGADILDGGNGGDTLAGGSGSDLLDGGNGQDMLDGGSDDDQLFGGHSQDALTGGTGTDTCDGGQSHADTADLTCETITSVP